MKDFALTRVVKTLKRVLNCCQNSGKSVLSFSSSLELILQPLKFLLCFARPNSTSKGDQQVHLILLTCPESIIGILHNNSPSLDAKVSDFNSFPYPLHKPNLLYISCIRKIISAGIVKIFTIMNRFQNLAGRPNKLSLINTSLCFLAQYPNTSAYFIVGFFSFT